jgi:hypothetical protein
MVARGQADAACQGIGLHQETRHHPDGNNPSTIKNSIQRVSVFDFVLIYAAQ